MSGGASAASMLVVMFRSNGSTLPRTCWHGGAGPRRRHGSWPAGSVARCGKRIDTCSALAGPGDVPVPDPAAVFTVKLPVPLIGAGPGARRRVGPHVVGGGRAGVGGVLGAGASRAPAPVSGRVVETEFVFDRLQAAELSAAYRILVPERPARAACARVRKRAVLMSNAAIYARVSSARQKEQETIRSQTAALRTHAERLGLDVPEQWVFEDDGHSGASLVRPALERLRDLVCQVPVDVLLVYSPDRLARKYAYQALLIEEFSRAGTPWCSSRARAATAPRTRCWCSSRA